MTQQTITAATTCDPATRATKSLLAYGVVAGPFYVAVSVTETLTRDGFDLRRHAWSLLSNGSLGWIHITTFVLTGLMIIAFAVGLRRALRPGAGATWGPRLMAVYGASLICAGIFRADPALGFPAGTPDGPGQISWHGILHFLSGGIGFPCLIAACFVLARRFTTEGLPGWAWSSLLTGILFGAGFAAVATSAGAAWGNLSFAAVVVLAFGWITAVAANRYRHVAHA